MMDDFVFKPKKGKLLLDPDEDHIPFQSKPIPSTKMEIEPFKGQPERKSNVGLTYRDENRMSTTSNSKPDTEKRINVHKEVNQKPVSRPSSSAMVEEKKVSDSNQKKSFDYTTQNRSVSRNTAKNAKNSENEDDGEEEEEEESEAESDSDSDDEDEDEESEEEQEPVFLKQKGQRILQSKKTQPQYDAKTGFKKVVRTKDDLVYDVLKRWWYCLPDWPPAEYDYAPLLEQKKLRVVDFKFWRAEKDIDDFGYRKVYEIPSYPGVYKNSKGENIDLRPRESCPCFENFKKKSVLELLELLVKALKNQINALQASPNCSEDLLISLKKELNVSERTLEVQRARAIA